MSNKILISDPHFHIWGLSTHEWLKNKDGLKNHPVGDMRPFGRDYMLNEFLNESSKYKIDKSVHIQCFHNDPLEETKMCQEFYEKHSHPSAIIGYAELQNKNIENVIKNHMKYKNFKGIRQCLDYHDKYENRRLCPTPDLMFDPNFHYGLQILEKYNLIFDMQLYPSQMKYASVLAASHRNLRIVLNHSGLPLPNELDTWRKGIDLLSKCNNVYCKLSGWGIANQNFDKNNNKFLEDITIYCLEKFGVDRCMFASDFPVDKVHKNYDYYWDNYFNILRKNGYNNEKIEKLTHSNAIKIYNLKINSKL